MRQGFIADMSIAVLCLTVLGLGSTVHANEERFFGEIIMNVTGTGHNTAKSEPTDSA